MELGLKNAREEINVKNIKDNLYKTFGTYNLIAVLSPSLRNIPFTGVEWSYQMKDLGYDERGILRKNKHDSESGDSRPLNNGTIEEENKHDGIHRASKVA